MDSEGDKLKFYLHNLHQLFTVTNYFHNSYNSN